MRARGARRGKRLGVRIEKKIKKDVADVPQFFKRAVAAQSAKVHRQSGGRWRKRCAIRIQTPHRIYWNTC